MSAIFGDPTAGARRQGREDAERLKAETEKLRRDAARDAARLAGLAAGKVTQTRARPVGGGLAGGGQAQRTGGVAGGKIGGPLGHRGPAGPKALGTAGE